MTDGQVGLDRVRTDAAARGLAIDIVQRPTAASLEAAAGLLGVDPSSVVKSLVVKRHDGSFLFALVPGGRQLSWRKLRTLVGVNKLRLPDAATAFEVTGFERGTITPLGSTMAWPVFADASILDRRVAMGAGAHGYSLFVDATALVTSFSAAVGDITDPERGPGSDDPVA